MNPDRGLFDLAGVDGQGGWLLLTLAPASRTDREAEPRQKRSLLSPEAAFPRRAGNPLYLLQSTTSLSMVKPLSSEWVA
ncbi:MAG: hypothetical protein V1816_05435 [Pseudomonadota bacterium]